MAKQIVYKVLSKENESCHGGCHDEWELPDGNKPGKWMEHEGNVKVCHSGWHVAVQGKLQEWFSDYADQHVYLAEIKGVQDKSQDAKIAAQFIRLIRPLDELDLSREGIFIDCSYLDLDETEFYEGVTELCITGNSKVSLVLENDHKITQISVSGSSNVSVSSDKKLTVYAFEDSMVDVTGNIYCEAEERSKVRAQGTSEIAVRSPKVQVVADDSAKIKYFADHNPQYVILAGNATMTYVAKRGKNMLRLAPGNKLEVESQAEKFDIYDTWEDIKEQHEDFIQKQTKK